MKTERTYLLRETIRGSTYGIYDFEFKFLVATLRRVTKSSSGDGQWRIVVFGDTISESEVIDVSNMSLFDVAHETMEYLRHKPAFEGVQIRKGGGVFKKFEGEDDE